MRNEGIISAELREIAVNIALINNLTGFYDVSENHVTTARGRL